MTFVPLRRLEGEVLRDLGRRPPCGCGQCRSRTGMPEDASEGAASSALGALAGIGKAAAAVGRAGSGLARWPTRTPGLGRAFSPALRRLGWSGWERRSPATLALLQRFAKTGAAPRGGKRVRYDLTPQGQALLDTKRFAALKPLFAKAEPHTFAFYDVGHPAGGRVRSDYVGTTSRPPGLRLIEHLNDPRSELYKGLHRPGAPSLAQEVVRVGHAPGPRHSAHAVEVLLQELRRPSWNSPDKHGFDA